METIVATAITLFFIMNPLGNVPVFLIVLTPVREARRSRIILRELLIALVVMLIFLFAGPAMLRAIGVSREAVAIAGGLVLMIIAIRMIFPLRGSSIMGDDDSDGEPLIVPLAVPLLAGPSLLATLMLRAGQDDLLHHTLPALLLAWAASALILLSSPFLYRIFGNRGLKAMERLMGMVLICISVQMLLNAFARLAH